MNNWNDEYNSINWSMVFLCWLPCRNHLPHHSGSLPGSINEDDQVEYTYFLSIIPDMKVVRLLLSPGQTHLQDQQIYFPSNQGRFTSWHQGSAQGLESTVKQYQGNFTFRIKSTFYIWQRAGVFLVTWSETFCTWWCREKESETNHRLDWVPYLGWKQKQNNIRVASRHAQEYWWIQILHVLHFKFTIHGCSFDLLKS